MAVILEETFTSALQDSGYISGNLSYFAELSENHLKITFDGTPYDCERIDAFMAHYYGGFSAEGPTFTEYPFAVQNIQSLNSSANFVTTVFTETAGTYTIKIETIEKSVNKVIYGETILIDLTSDTVTADKLMQGYTAHDRTGAVITGTAPDPSIHTVKCILSDTSPTRTIQIGSGSRTPMTNGAEYTFNTGDTIITRIVDGGAIYYNGELVKSSESTVSYTFTAPSKDLEISCASDKMYIVENEGAVIQPLSVTQNGTYTAPSGVDGYSPITVNVSGGGSPNLQNKTVSPSESQQSVQADSGYDGLDTVTVNAISSTYVGTGITRRSSTDLTASGATVTVPSGYYSAQASKAVASGSAGTPTATKGTVSNHAISVTPSVTNTTGYITGGTKTGTAVTVSASELVSGSETKTSNGTYDVTNLASLVVSIPFVTYYTGSTNPASSLGSNGDIYLKVVS